MLGLYYFHPTKLYSDFKNPLSTYIIQLKSLQHLYSFSRSRMKIKYPPTNQVKKKKINSAHGTSSRKELIFAKQLFLSLSPSPPSNYSLARIHFINPPAHHGEQTEEDMTTRRPRKIAERSIALTVRRWPVSRKIIPRFNYRPITPACHIFLPPLPRVLVHSIFLLSCTRASIRGG